MIRNHFIRHLRDDQSGATLTEFGLVAPILIMMIMGIFDLAHTQYTTALVNGALQKAGRDLTLETAGSRESTIDGYVISQINNVVPSTATIRLEKLSHFDFEDIGEEEDYDDDNLNGVCDNNEVFVDTNRNGQWDADRGEEGIGGARDAVVYTAIVTYPRVFPMYGLAGLPQEVELRATTVLRNQPYDQQDLTVESGNCF